MSISRDIASLAAGLASGVLTNNFVLGQLGGDESLMDEVIALVAGMGAGSIVSNITSDFLDEDDGIIGDFFDDVDDMFDF